jgi:hypothetical protein
VNARVDEYAYIYNKEEEQRVPGFGFVTFSNIGLLSAGFSFVPGGVNLGVVDTGLYKIQFLISTGTAGPFAICINGTPAPGGSFEAPVANQNVNGFLMTSINGGDTISVRNIGTQALALNDPVNASLLVEKLL